MACLMCAFGADLVSLVGPQGALSFWEWFWGAEGEVLDSVPFVFFVFRFCFFWLWFFLRFFQVFLRFF